MTKTAIASFVVFLILLSLVFITREEKVAVGVRTLELSKRGASLNAEALKEIRVENPQAEGAPSVVLLKKEGDAFKLIKANGSFDTDDKSIEALKMALSTLEVGDFVSARKEKQADLEIDDAKGQKVRLVFENETLDLVFGRFAKGGGNFLRKANSDEVFVGKGTFSGVLKKAPNDWRKRSIIEANEEDFKALRFEKGDSVVEIERPDKTWRLKTPARPEFFKADPERMQKAVSEFTKLRAADFADDGRLGKVYAKIIASTSKGEIVLLVGGPNEKKEVKVQVQGRPQVYLLSEYSGASLVKGLGAFRDLHLISFDASKVVRADFISAAEKVSVEKKKGEWTLLTKAPPTFDFDKNQVLGKLEGLNRLKVTQFIGPGVIKSGKQPVKITLYFEDESQKSIIFGAPLKGEDGKTMVYAMASDEAIQYGVPAFQKSRYENALMLFKRAPAPPPGPPGGMQGLDQLPPELRQQLLNSMGQNQP